MWSVPLDRNVSRLVSRIEVCAIVHALNKSEVEKIDGIEIVSRPDLLFWVGATSRKNGQPVQAALMTAVTVKGTSIYWLQGPTAKFILRNDNRALITNKYQAEERARQVISSGQVPPSQLYPLDSYPINGHYVTASGTEITHQRFKSGRRESGLFDFEEMTIKLAHRADQAGIPGLTNSRRPVRTFAIKLNDPFSLEDFLGA